MFGCTLAKETKVLVFMSAARMLDKLVPQLRAQVRPHLPGEAESLGAHERDPARRAAPPREAHERGRGGRGGRRRCSRARGGQAAE